MEYVFQNTVDKSVFLLDGFTASSLDRLVGSSDLFRVFWVRQGSAEFVVDGYSVFLGRDQLLFLTPAHNLDSRPESDKVVGLGWNREFYCIRDNDSEVGCDGLLFFGSSRTTVVDLDQKDRIRFEGLFELIEEELVEQDGIQEEMLRVLLKRWLLLSTRLLTRTLPFRSGEQAEMDICRRFNIEVEKNFRELHKVSDYATLLYKSPKTLSNLFAMYGSTAPHQLINDRIILEAKRLARYSSKTVKEIVMKTIKVPEISEVSAESAALLGNVKAALGFVPNIYAVIGYSSDALKRFLSFSTGAGKNSFSPGEVEAVKLAVSEADNCRYCSSAHTALALGQGFSEEDTLQFRSVSSADPRIRALTHLAREIALHAGNVDAGAKDDFFAQGFEEKDLVNLVAIVLSVTFTNYVFGLTQIEIDFPEARSLENRAA